MQFIKIWHSIKKVGLLFFLPIISLLILSTSANAQLFDPYEHEIATLMSYLEKKEGRDLKQDFENKFYETKSIKSEYGGYRNTGYLTDSKIVEVGFGGDEVTQGFELKVTDKYYGIFENINLNNIQEVVKTINKNKWATDVVYSPKHNRAAGYLPNTNYILSIRQYKGYSAIEISTGSYVAFLYNTDKKIYGIVGDTKVKSKPEEAIAKSKVQPKETNRPKSKPISKNSQPSEKVITPPKTYVYNYLDDKGSMVVEGFLESIEKTNKDRLAFIAPSYLNRIDNPNIKISTWGKGLTYYITESPEPNSYIFFFRGSVGMYIAYTLYTIEENGKIYIKPFKEYSGKSDYYSVWTTGGVNHHKFGYLQFEDYLEMKNIKYGDEVIKTKVSIVVKADEAQPKKKEENYATLSEIDKARLAGKSTLEDRANQAWEGYKNSSGKTCPVCNGSGKEYVSRTYTDTETTYSEDYKAYRKSSEKVQKERVDVLKCYRCKGTGKIKKQ